MKAREIITMSGNITVRPTTVFVYENIDGTRWYIAEGGTLVNKTYDLIDENVNIELLEDIDCFSVNDSIEELGQFIGVIEE
jgi:hypothetical protein